MTKEQFLNKIAKNKKGTFTKVCFERPVKTLKKFGELNITKRTQGSVRFGVEYDNMKSVILKRENGILPKENNGLRYGEWLLYPYLIEYNNQIYVRMTLSDGTKLKSEYYLNNIKVDKESITQYLTSSELTPSKKTDIISVKIENIIDIK